ncbi:MAG: DUF1294 domain-containing protein [Oscillospiraceae bacterium]|nr:DUF1294 domain-containing protein [Oscillospiraceae bacterium]
MLIIVFYAYVLVFSLVAFAASGLDKLFAKSGAWRIPERTLILFAALGGAFGAALGMNVFRHKTQKGKFKLVYVFLVLWLILCVIVGYLLRSDLDFWLNYLKK